MARSVTTILDSGANENIFRDKSVGCGLTKSKLGIETAKKGDTLEALDMGSIDCLKFNDGAAASCLKKVLFSEKVLDNIVSVGRVCDGGHVVVFDAGGTSVFDARSFRADGDVVHKESRDGSGMYPLTLVMETEGAESSPTSTWICPSTSKAMLLWRGLTGGKGWLWRSSGTRSWATSVQAS